MCKYNWRGRGAVVVSVYPRGKLNWKLLCCAPSFCKLTCFSSKVFIIYTYCCVVYMCRWANKKKEKSILAVIHIVVFQTVMWSLRVRIYTYITYVPMWIIKSQDKLIIDRVVENLYMFVWSGISDTKHFRADYMLYVHNKRIYQPFN